MTQSLVSRIRARDHQLATYRYYDSAGARVCCGVADLESRLSSVAAALTLGGNPRYP